MEESKTFEYAITARKTRKPVLKEHYEDYLSYIGDIGEVGNVNFETTRGMHCHFILKTDKKVNYRSLRPTKYGWNVKAVPIYNREGWISYSEKDLHSVKPLSDKQQSKLRKKILDMNCCNGNKVTVTN